LGIGAKSMMTGELWPVDVSYMDRSWVGGCTEGGVEIEYKEGREGGVEIE
jgi:hypothetical protein